MKVITLTPGDLLVYLERLLVPDNPSSDGGLNWQESAEAIVHWAFITTGGRAEHKDVLNSKSS